MKLNWLYVAIFLAGLLLGYVCFSGGNKDTEKRLTEQVSSYQKQVTELETKLTEQLKINKDLTTKETITVTKPDGTREVIERTTVDRTTVDSNRQQSSTQTSQTESASSRTTVKSESSKVALSKYSLYVMHNLPDVSWDLLSYRAGVAARLGSSPLFLQADYEVKQGFSVGVRLDW